MCKQMAQIRWFPRSARVTRVPALTSCMFAGSPGNPAAQGETGEDGSRACDPGSTPSIVITQRGLFRKAAPYITNHN